MALVMTAIVTALVLARAVVEPRIPDPEEEGALAPPIDPGPFPYAPVRAVRAEPPPRLWAPFPRVAEFGRFLRDDPAFPPPAHVADLLCAGDADAWRRALAALRASSSEGTLSPRDVDATYGALVRRCRGDGCFAAPLVAGDRPVVALPAWLALARCGSPDADRAFARADVPPLAREERARILAARGAVLASAGERAPSPAAARLRALGLVPSGGAPAGEDGRAVLLSAGAALEVDPALHGVPGEREALVRALARLPHSTLRGADFEEVAAAAGQPAQLRVYAGGLRYEVDVPRGPTHDLAAEVGLLNAVARARGDAARWAVLAGAPPAVACGPETSLRAAFAQGLLSAR